MPGAGIAKERVLTVRGNNDLSCVHDAWVKGVHVCVFVTNDFGRRGEEFAREEVVGLMWGCMIFSGWFGSVCGWRD